MKALIVTNMFPTAEDPSFGCFVKSQVDSLREKGVLCDLIFVNGRSSKLNYLRGAWRVFWKSLHDSYDLVHAHYGLSGLLARCQWRSPIVVSFCGSDVMDSMQGKISRLVSRLVDRSILKSHRLARALGGKNVRILPNGLDLSVFRPMDHLRAKRTLSFAPEDRYILFLGDPGRKVKRLDVAQQTYEMVRNRLYQPVQLIVLHCHPQREVPLYMNACDVLLLTSDWEGSPNAVKEAMACNLPIVSTDVGDVREIIQGTDNCFVCPQEPSVLADKIITILNSGARTKGRERVGRLSLEKTADRLLSIYRELLG